MKVRSPAGADPFQSDSMASFHVDEWILTMAVIGAHPFTLCFGVFYAVWVAFLVSCRPLAVASWREQSGLRASLLHRRFTVLCAGEKSDRSGGFSPFFPAHGDTVFVLGGRIRPAAGALGTTIVVLRGKEINTIRGLWRRIFGLLIELTLVG